MFKINYKTKIYIVSPYHNTGGPKSLHQLANILVKKGLNTYIVYYNNGNFIGGRDILYDFCDAKVARNIIDDGSNIIIVPEIYQELLSNYSNINKVIWWLSLDFYFSSTIWGAAKSSVHRKRLPSLFAPLVLINYFIKDPSYLKRQKRLKVNNLKKYFHMYNCEYERIFLEKHGVPKNKLVYLCGPLEERFYKLDFNDIKLSKKDIVAYNPAKMDMSFLKKIQYRLFKINSNIEFVAIQNMTREQVYDTLKSAKVYIDFGYFPGPERMPREAVALYCNIITSTEGSAENDVDVLVPKEFKFNTRDKKNISLVADLINKMIVNYYDYVKYGDAYRQKVWNQIDSFSDQINKIFEEDFDI